jgi:predicted SprT family Zn-dependent metalloprotease
MEPSARDDVRRRLTAELEAGLVRELSREHGHLGWAHFRNKLRPVAMRLSDTQLLGRWLSAERTIEMSRELCTQQPWGVVIEVLKHEMAHQYVDEVLGVRDESAHGPAFREVCQRLGVDGRAHGMPTPQTRSEEEERVLSRIAKLLALAQSDAEHEAQAAMSAAQRLMLKYNLDLAASRATLDYGFRHLGTPRTRVFEAERLLAVILQEHFFVDVIWVPVYVAATQRRATVLEVCGTTANLDLADYVHGFLLSAGERLFAEQRRRSGTAGRERRSFLAGVMAGFLAKLNEQKKAQQEQGLVWVGDADLGVFYRQRHPRVQTTRYASGGRSEARELGREAGRSLVLHRPVGAGAAATSGGPRLLGPRR